MEVFFLVLRSRVLFLVLVLTRSLIYITASVYNFDDIITVDSRAASIARWVIVGQTSVCPALCWLRAAKNSLTTIRLKALRHRIQTLPSQPRSLLLQAGHYIHVFIHHECGGKLVS